MKAYFDTEFQCYRKSVTFASIAIVRDDGAELHLVSNEFQIDRQDWFFFHKVWKHMRYYPRVPVAKIADAVREFLSGVTVLATREGGQDRKMLEGLVGPLWMDYVDLQQVWHDKGCPKLPKRVKKHDALEDARWHRSMFETLFHDSNTDQGTEETLHAQAA